jgi:hypothetical protein
MALSESVVGEIFRTVHQKNISRSLSVVTVDAFSKAGAGILNTAIREIPPNLPLRKGEKHIGAGVSSHKCALNCFYTSLKKGTERDLDQIKNLRRSENRKTDLQKGHH